MIFILAARHRKTQEVAGWIIERDSLWAAMKNRGDIEAPPMLSPEWIAGCDIALMEPGTKYSGDIWDEIQRANQEHEATGLEPMTVAEASRRLSDAILMGGIKLHDDDAEKRAIEHEMQDDLARSGDPAENRPFGDALTFEENRIAEDQDQEAHDEMMDDEYPEDPSE